MFNSKLLNYQRVQFQTPPLGMVQNPLSSLKILPAEKADFPVDGL